MQTILQQNNNLIYKDFVRGIKRFLKSFISNGQKWKDIICKQQNRSAIQKQLLLMHHVIINVPLAKISTSDYLDIKFLQRCTTYLLYCITDNPSFVIMQAYNIRMITTVHSLQSGAINTLCILSWRQGFIIFPAR